MSVQPAQLRSFPALADLGDADLAMMAPVLEATRLRAGALVCREGDAGDCCYFLLQGEISVSKLLPDGRRVRLAKLGPGALFGQSGLLPGQLRTADVKAETDLVLATLGGRSLRWALGQRQAWAVAVQALVAINLVRQLRQALDRLEGLAAAEDPTAEVEGRARAEVPRPQGLDATFEGVRARARTKTADPGPPASPEDDEAARTGQLLSLLAESESSITAAGYDLDAVEFVFDDDQLRTSEARKGS